MSLNSTDTVSLWTNCVTLSWSAPLDATALGCGPIAGVVEMALQPTASSSEPSSVTVLLHASPATVTKTTIMSVRDTTTWLTSSVAPSATRTATQAASNNARAVIGGSVVGGVAVLIVVGALGAFAFRHRRKRSFRNHGGKTASQDDTSKTPQTSRDEKKAQHAESGTVENHAGGAEDGRDEPNNYTDKSRLPTPVHPIWVTRLPSTSCRYRASNSPRP
jgi:hypothetical protein